MWEKLQQFVNWLADIVYPRFCLGCGRMGEFLCDRCYGRLNFIVERDLVPTLFARSHEPVYLQRLQALIVYDQLTKKMIHHYKYLGVKDLASTFAYWLYEFSDCWLVDVITFIPIHKKRHAERGYNQARLIAQELARLSGVPCVPLLARPVYKQKQALSKNKAERLQKTKNIFAALPNSLARDSRILLVDDVVTSGATLNEAARVLVQNGFGDIRAVAIAHGD